jgi:ATP-binding cassette subfamily B protein
MKLFKKYYKSYIKLFLIAVFFLSLETFADLMQPFLVSKLIDKGVSNHNLEQIWFYGFLMLITTVVGLISALTRNYISSNVSFGVSRDLRKDLYSKLVYMNQNQIESFDRGSIITRITGDVNQIQQFTNGMMRIFLKSPFSAIGAIIMVSALDIRLAMTFLIIVPISFLIIYLNIKVGFPLYAKIQNRLDKLNFKTMEFLNGIRVVKAFGRTLHEEREFKQINDNLTDSTINTMRITSIFGPLIQFVINMAIVFILYMGGTWVNEGTFTIGQIVAFVNYMTQFLFAMSVVSRVFTMFVKAGTSSTRIEEILFINTEEYKKDEISNFGSIEGCISLKNVYYRYGEGEYTLKNISFDIESGSTVGILGATGSGKTTLANVIHGFYKPEKGNVYFGGLDSEKLKKSTIRELISHVEQKTLLFSGSIMENLKWGNRDAEEEILKSSLRISKANEFVSKLPDGGKSKIGKGGVNLSGGQKQRLSIARALVHKPKIIILDDSTSSVDILTEKDILDQMSKFNPNMTKLIISQRVSTVMNLDKILVLNNGELVGNGTHQELIQSCLEYKDIFESQIGEVK